MNQIICRALAVLALTLAAPGARAAEALTCEYLVNPRGLECAAPRLSWKLSQSSGARGERQTAYQILVASSLEKLNANHGDLWDSGKVTSDASALVNYKGVPLASRQQCWWKVRTWDANDRAGRWSKPAQWEMGLLAREDWTAQWIGTGESFTRGAGWPSPDNTLPDPWFRQTVVLPAKAAHARAYVASVGYHELWINGRKIGDAVLAPSVTDNSQRARYLTYDISAALRPGTNVLAFWLGTSWSIFPHYATADKPRAPIVLGQFEVTLPDGRQLRHVTDASWRTHPSPGTLLGVWDFMHYGGELYDANKEIPGWAEATLDDSNWQRAKVFQPALELASDIIEPNRPLTPLKAVAVTEPQPGVFRVDMGKNFTGWTEIAVRGQPGDRIEFQFSEQETEAMMHRLHNVYVIGPSGKGTFRNRFNYSVGRWITITGLRAKPALGDVRGWLVRNDFAPAARFECSNPLLNDIHATTVWTLENLSLGGYVVDCSHRERMGYGGDAHATTTTALNHFNLGAFYTKWAQDWRDVQGREARTNKVFDPAVPRAAEHPGSLPHTAPTYWGGGGPSWGGYCVHLPWELYRQYGDTRILADNYPMMTNWLAFLESKSQDNLLRRWGGDWDFLGDWLWPGANGVNSDTRESLFLNNCYWIYNVQTVARIAGLLGHPDEAQRLTQRAEILRRAVHAEFFNAADHSYVNGYQAYLAAALLAEVPPAELRPAVWQRLENEIRVVRHGHIHAGITGGALLFKVLMEARRDDLLHTMVAQEDYPGWGFMLRSGATAIWESWHEKKKPSLMHSSYLYVGAWFTHGVLGIQPDEAAPGFKHFVIHPAPLDRPDLTWARGHYDSIHGRIAVEWRRNGDDFTLNVTVPPNTTAQVHLPAANADRVTESGRALNHAKGIFGVKPAGKRLAVEVGSGTYRFACKPSPGQTANRLEGRATRLNFR